MSTAKMITVSGAGGRPIAFFNVERASALDAILFIHNLIDMLGLERMAQKEGRTFDHLLGQAVGAQLIDPVSAHPTVPG